MFRGPPDASAKGVLVRQAHATDPTRIEQRLWAKVHKGEGCWEWIGKRSNGYGYFSMSHKYFKATRVIYELLVGAIPEGLHLDHLCRNRGCVNPTHLEAVTNRINGLRGTSFAAVNARKTRCPQGHPYDAANTGMSNGWRYCRICNAQWCRERRERKRIAAGP